MTFSRAISFTRSIRRRLKQKIAFWKRKKRGKKVNFERLHPPDFFGMGQGIVDNCINLFALQLMKGSTGVSLDVDLKLEKEKT